MVQHHLPALTRPTLCACALLFLLLASLPVLHAQTQRLQDGEGGGDQSQASAFGHVLRQQLLGRGLDRAAEEDAAVLMRYALAAQLLGVPTARNSKRAGWKRIPIQTRFAPFGTKLIPSRSRGDSSGPTLLRYGRSTA